MNLKTTFVLLVLAVAGVGAWILSGLRTPAKVPDAGTRQVLEAELKAPNLRKIEVRAGNRTAVFQRSGETWTMPGNWPTRQLEVKQLVDLLVSLHSRFEPIPLPHDERLGAAQIL